MNRTERLYGVVEELRAGAPRPVPASSLAGRFEVSIRTIQRDIDALQRSGVPIWSDTGVRGGYAIDPATALPAVNLTPGEAVAVAVALEAAGHAFLSSDGRSALRKIRSVMADEQVARAEDLADRVRVTHGRGRAVATEVRRAVEQAITERIVVNLDYADRDGSVTQRPVEAHGLVATPSGSYLVGWCRMRDDRRLFRLDRIRSAHPTTEPAPPRRLDDLIDALDGPARRPSLDGGPAVEASLTVPTIVAGYRDAHRRLQQAAAGVDVEPVRILLVRLVERLRWWCSELRADVDGRPPVLDGLPPMFPDGWNDPMAADTRNRLIDRFTADRSTADVLVDLDAVHGGFVAWLESRPDSDLGRTVTFGDDLPGSLRARLTGWWSPLVIMRRTAEDLDRRG